MSGEAATAGAPLGSDRGWRLLRRNRRDSRPASRRWLVRRGARPEASRLHQAGASSSSLPFASIGSQSGESLRRRPSRKSQSRESRVRQTRRLPRPAELLPPPCAPPRTTAYLPTVERPRSASTNRVPRRTSQGRPRRVPEEEGLLMSILAGLTHPRCTRTRLWWSTSPIRPSPTRCDGACNRRAPVCFDCTRRACRRGRSSCRGTGFTTGRGFGRWPEGCSRWCRCCP
mmetsp:Transcript_9559/g.37260  ORF Transcript_9559/g.37260 Transcript_9559/m.37260 type:complete len:229 (+) Transcript_9559:524-1210(+)